LICAFGRDRACFWVGGCILIVGLPNYGAE
jgi:hypothetical protein